MVKAFQHTSMTFVILLDCFAICDALARASSPWAPNSHAYEEASAAACCCQTGRSSPSRMRFACFAARAIGYVVKMMKLKWEDIMPTLQACRFMPRP